jgi:small subunit ribosomal protein S17
MSQNNESQVNPTAAGEAEQSSRGRRKTRVGTVVSDKMNKTVVVRVERRYAHPLYGKQVTRSKKYHAHDENNEYQVGDVVRIVETRPLSKLKRWRVAEVIERAK